MGSIPSTPTQGEIIVIDIGDKVLVLGEADEVFEVIAITENGNFILDTGFLEPKEKCFKIPEKFLKYVKNRRLPFDPYANKVYGVEINDGV